MWALLADNESSDSQEAAKRDMQPVVVPNGEVVGMGCVGNGGEVAIGDQKGNDKKTRATAVSNGNVSNGAAHVQSSHGPTKGRNKEPNKQQEAVRGGSCV